MTSSFAEKPRSGFPNLTKSEKAVANYMVTHLKSLPYETAASIAESTGVSSMTVSRFLRGLGYNGLSELKEQLRTELESTPLLISDRLARIRKASKRGSRRRGDLTAPTTEFLLKPRPQTLPTTPLSAGASTSDASERAWQRRPPWKSLISRLRRAKELALGWKVSMYAHARGR